MARISVFIVRLLFLLLAFSGNHVQGVKIGINYGRLADNLPPPSRVVSRLKSLNVSRVKIYDADPVVLQAFAGSNIDLTIGLGESLESMVDPKNARNWVDKKVKPFLPATRITCITLGNEVFSTGSMEQVSKLLPAMRSVHGALIDLSLDQQVTVTTAHALGMLASSTPPSSGSFREEYVEYLKPILEFQSMIRSPFSINAYPFFAYKENPKNVPLDYALFQPNNGTTDPRTNLHYDNMLFAQIDAVYSALEALGHKDIDIVVSETGWPSKGDADEAGATRRNAELYNSNLIRRVEQKQGTPAKPSVPIKAYVFALFNENLKPGPTSERNYGLFFPDETPVYDTGLQDGFRNPSAQEVAAASSVNVFPVLSLLISAVLYSIYT